VVGIGRVRRGQYVPKALARYPRSKRANTVALILADRTNLLFTIIARGRGCDARRRFQQIDTMARCTDHRAIVSLGDTVL
jgi:DNA-binding LacI/PurR family transcriptional regulator